MSANFPQSHVCESRWDAPRAGGTFVRRAGLAAATMLLASMAWTSPSWAQPASGGNGGGGGGSGGGGAVATPQAMMGEVVIKLDRFGAGGIARAGDWFGARVTINDATTKQRTVLVRMACQDTDGDTPVYQRELTTNPGTDQPVWLYGRLPYGAGRGTTNVVVSVFEAIEGGGGGSDGDVEGRGGSAFRAGRLLGQLPLAPNSASIADPSNEIMGVFGPRTLGLSGYGTLPDPSLPEAHPYGNEHTELAAGITPADVPDRWMGLAAFNVILWAQGKPEELRGERSRAMREWIERGGHLVIILPQAGQTWTTPASNELYDVMPMVSITRSESEPMKGFRPIFTRPLNPGAIDQFPRTGTVHFFQPLAEAEANQAMRIINGPDGRCVVARRLVGAGAVTLIGIDLNSTAFSQQNQIETDVFWHRILGRRGDFSPATTTTAGGRRDRVTYDEFLGPSINQTGRSAVGVLMGFVVFLLYWIVAGPGGFALLKRKSQHHHAWLFFVATGVGFTGLAWSGASLLRPKRIECKHVTFIDHVYGQPTDRARVWGSVLVPWYGEATLAIGEPGRSNTEPHHSLNALSAWDPEEESSVSAAFPDARSYFVNARSPDVMKFPSRSTVKQFRADWAGGPRWPMPLPINDDGSPGRLQLLRTGGADSATAAVRGTLTHDLPGALTDVTVVVVPRQRIMSASSTGSPPSSAEVYVYDNRSPWKPGEQLDLEQLTAVSAGQATVAGRRFENWIMNLSPRSGAIAGVSTSSPSADIALTGLAFYSMLPPADRSGNGSIPASLRRHSHGWDLGMWMTQPCVIVVARLNDAETPVPLMINGKTFASKGVTVMRWVYPFPDNPPEVSGAGAVPSDGSGDGKDPAKPGPVPPKG